MSLFGNRKILDTVNFNFNSLLENSVVLNIYNIYLVAVDFLIIVGVIILAKNVIMEVFSK